MFDQSIFARTRDLTGGVTDARAGRVLAVVRLALVAVPFLWAIGYFFPPLNHDVSALLQFAQRMLHGERLYVDLVDINPPAIFLLDAVPVALAEALGLPVVDTFVAAVLALCALTFWLSTELLGRLGEGQRPLGALVWPAVLAFALVCYPLHSFGQREHLLLIFTLPYALAAAARADGRALPPALIAGTALYALLGIMLKPYFAFVPLALELLVLARVGWPALRSSAPWLILGACIAYVAVVRATLPEYFSMILPMVAQCYEQLDLSIMLGLFTRDQVPALLLPLIPLAVIAFRLPEARLSRAMVCLALAATAAGIVQGKGWDYHFFAARAALILCFGAVIVDGYNRIASGSLLGTGAMRVAAPVGIAVTVMAAIFAFSGVLNPPFKGPRNFVNTAASRFQPVIQAHAAERPVLWLTTSIYPQFPVLNYTHSKLAMPFMSLWMMPALYGPETAAGGAVAYRAPTAMGSSEKLVWRGVIDGFVREKPALVVVEDARREGAFRGVPFDYLDYFLRDPAFAAEWANYAPLTKVDNATIYRRR